MEKLEELVKSAVGYVEERGDKVTFASMPFSPAAPLAEIKDASMGPWDYFNALWRPISALLFLLLLIGVMRATRRLGEAPTEILDAPKSVRELEEALGGGALPGMEGEAGPPKVRPEPDKAAAVIKGWLSEG